MLSRVGFWSCKETELASALKPCVPGGTHWHVAACAATGRVLVKKREDRS